MGFRGHFRHEDFRYSRWRKWFSGRKFCAVISKRQSYIISKRIQNCSAHFERTVDISFQNDRDRCRSFRNESHISSRKDKQAIFSAGCLPIEFGQDSIGKHSEHAKGVQKTVSFEMSFQSDSWYIISKWLRALSLLSKRQSYIISKREYIYHLERIIIYHL